MECLDVILYIILFALLALPAVSLLSKRGDRRKPAKTQAPGETPPKEPSYDELLRTPQWRAKRESVMRRDNYTCQWCRRRFYPPDLRVHHRYYRVYPDGRMRLPWDYEDEALMTVCDKCHAEIHRRYRIKTYRDHA